MSCAISTTAGTARSTASPSLLWNFLAQSLRDGRACRPFAIGSTAGSASATNTLGPTKTALDVYTERFGVCRDFHHLAVTMCRALNIPARYVTGYLGDIGIPVTGIMDFSAWFEVYLENRWWALDARNNIPRIGRVLIAAGRDASDVAITTSLGMTTLTHFTVVTDQVQQPIQAANVL
jgi:transglutaminase-like putative cysteine protease